MKKIVLGISGGISFALFLVLFFLTGSMGKSQLSQTAAERWGGSEAVSQVSCFFSVGAGITEDRIMDFEHSIDKALTDASVIQESENPGARLWADAYSADGQVTISTDKASITADAVGIGGDFFLFHPVPLLYGAYFSGNDVLKDYCVIDEDAAWQLFGSSDVAGMVVYIGGIPHVVTGVVERPSGRLAEAAGLDSTLVYVSCESLEENGKSNGINHYEIVMPNPVSGFAENYIRENLGADEKETEVLENTSRYSFLSRCQLLLEFGTRSMNGKAIIYPYWENIARGYEDILALLTLFELLLVIYPIGLAMVFFCIWWRHKGWTMKDVWHKLQDFAERRIEKLRETRKERKAKEAGEAEPGEEASGKKIRKKRKKRKKSEYDDFDEAEEAGAEEMPGEPSAEEAGAEEMSGEQSAEGARKKRRFGWRRGGRKNEEA